MTSTVNGSDVQQSTPGAEERPILEVKDLQVAFNTQEGKVTAVDGVNLTLYRGQSLAIVGESGSGKSTTAHAIINLLPGTGHIAGGQILLDGQDISKASEKEMQAIRGRKIGFVPQDPMSNLNPVWSIGFQVEEAVRANGIASGRKEAKARAIEVLKQAGLQDADRHQVLRLGKSLPQPHRAFELAVVVLRLPHLAAGQCRVDRDRRVVDQRARHEAALERGRVDERLEARARLPPRLRHVIELVQVDVESADQRADRAVP